MGAKADLTATNVAALWAGVLIGPMVWAADLTISYAITKWSCGHQAHAVMHGISVIAFIGVLGGGYFAWTAERPNERAEFMAMLGILGTILFATLVVATAIPRLILDVCQ